MTFATNNQLNNKQRIAYNVSRKWHMNFFFVKYKYDDFIHGSKDEFLQQLQCTPIRSHMVT